MSGIEKLAFTLFLAGVCVFFGWVVPGAQEVTESMRFAHHRVVHTY
jgi:hypothetical protein